MENRIDETKDHAITRPASKTSEADLEKPAAGNSAGLLYRLTVAFPSWAGAILVLYGFFMSRGFAQRIRLR